MFGRHLFTNRWLWLSLGAVAVLQVLAVQAPPLQDVFGTTALRLTDWLLAVGLAALVLVIEEAWKVLDRLRARARTRGNRTGAEPEAVAASR